MHYQYNAAAFCYPYHDAVICNLMNCAAILHTPLHAALLNTPMSEFILYEWPSFVNVCCERKRRPTAEVGAANEVNEGPKYLSSAFLTYIRQSKSTLLWTQIEPQCQLDQPNPTSTNPFAHLSAAIRLRHILVPPRPHRWNSPMVDYRKTMSRGI